MHLDLKGKITGSVGKQLGMTPKGSPRLSQQQHQLQSEPESSSLKNSQTENSLVKHNIRGGRQASQKKASDKGKGSQQQKQYVPPS